MTTAVVSLSQAFANLKALFESSELKGIWGPVAVAASNFAANPTASNGVAQLAALQAAVFAVQPGIMQTELQAISALIAEAAQNAVAPKV